MREVIEHATDPEKLLRECKRILKPEGFLVLTTPNYDNPLLFLVENIYNRFFSTFKPYLADVHPSKFGKRRLNETIGKHFVNVNVGTIDLGINLTAVARSSSS
jgi:ubiquinone/menaquinone biosynthesis C-methylase UbiE